MALYLITRPKNQAQYAAQNLKALGHEFLIDSMIDIEVSKKISNLDFSKFSHFIITSANACKYISKLNLDKDKIFFTVGDKSREEIKKLGFKNVINAQNSAILLRDLMVKELDQSKDKILYFRADIVSYDLEKFFRNKNFYFNSVISYKSNEVSEFQQKTIDKLKTKEIDKILIYSQRAAEVFYKLSKTHGILNKILDVEIVCLSQNIATFFYNKKFLKITIKS
jgi:uroporphyrinogen-III synthase